MSPNDIIKTQTLVFGVETSNLTDDQLFEMLKDVDVEIAKFKDINNAPSKLKQRIDELHNQRIALCKFIDKR